MKKKGEAEQDSKPEKKKKAGAAKKGFQLPFARNQKQGSGIASYAATVSGSSLLVIMALALAMAWMQFGEHQQRSAQQLAEASARQQVALINLSLGHSERLVNALAGSPVVADIFTSGMDDEAVALSQSVPDGRLILAPADQLLPGADLSFTARDLIQKTRRDGSAAITVVGGEQPHVLAARRVENSEHVILLEQSLKPLLDQISRLDLQGGYLELALTDSNGTLLTRGTRIAGPTANQDAGGGIQVRYTAFADTGDGALQTLFVTLVLGALALLLAVQLFSFRSISAALKKDAALLTHYAEDLPRGGTTRSRGHFSFPPFAAVTSSLDKLQASMTSSRIDQQPRAKKKKAPDPMLNMLIEDEPAADESGPAHNVPSEEIFRAYDIRGIVGKNLDEGVMEVLGLAIGSEALDNGQKSVVVGRDGRHSSPPLAQSLINGIRQTGCNVIDIGAAPTPVVYYATSVLDTQSGVVITGSHNPSDYNGIKIVIAGVTLHGDRILALRKRIEANQLASGEGSVSQQDLSGHYSGAITQDIVLARSMKVVIDCGNGIAGAIAPALFEELGCEVIPLYAEVDGDFPNHHPDPGKPENLETLIATVKEQGADLGIAFDGDGDRLGVVTPSGEIIWPDRLMMLYARDLLSRSPGADIIFDIKCSRELGKLITRMGGRPLMYKSGHSLIKAKLKETGAALAGEMSGHIFFADRWYGFDDGLYSAARLLEILSLESGSADDVFARLKTGFTTPEMTIAVSEARKFELIEQLVAMADQFTDGNPNSLDGLRVDFADGWGLVRASNTTPMLTARFEGQDSGALERIQKLFRDKLLAIDNSLDVPF